MRGGRVSVPGVYGGMADKFPIGAFTEKGLTMRTGQTHVQKYSAKLLEMIQQGKLDTTFLISHHASLEDGPRCTGTGTASRTSTPKPELEKGRVKELKETRHELA